MNIYLLPFIKSFIVSVILIYFLIWIFGKIFKIIKIKTRKRISSRHIHSSNISRLGGIAIILAFIVTILVDKNLFIIQSLWGIIFASILILIVGVYDDFFELDWKIQLFFQIAVAVLIFIMGVRIEFITNPFGGYIFLNIGKYIIPSLFFVIIWVVLIINSMNWLDGIDGLSGGVAFIGALTIFFLSLKPEVNQPPMGIITMALAGAIAGFLIFNFRPAMILAGTSGSMFMGFILATLSIFAGVKIATALLVLTIPVIDTIWVIGERIRTGNSIFKSDKRHLHYKLMELGWSQRKISFLYYFITLFIAIVALNTKAIGKMITIILATVIMIFVLLAINKKIDLKITSKR
jgi:UDP-GlcNAc:undecaprenyl-phosphate/decaprenyl-phosphate GlcNAc-1-phosphate transferase